MPEYLSLSPPGAWEFHQVKRYALIRLGIIGAGAVAHFHARAAAALPGVEMVAVCDLQLDAAQKVAEPLGAAVYTDYRSMYEQAALDAVIVNTPHSLHLEMVLAAAEAGIHVLVEKPMATSLEDCRLMTESCSRAGITLVVGHIQHFLPEKTAAETFLRSGALGKLLMIRDYRSTDYRPGTRPDWFFDPSVAGGGALMNIGGHCIDRSLWLGDSPVNTVDARILNRFGVPVETDGYVRLLLRNGVEVNIVIVSDPPHRADEILLICEQGSISCTPDRGTVVRHNGSSTTLCEPSPSGIQDGFTAQLSDFVETLHGSHPKVSNSHARSVVETVLAAYRSASTRRVVALSEPAAPATLENALGR